MRKILVVEDSQTIRKAIEIALKAEDYHIAFCSKSEDVLPLVNEIIPNAILVDIRMDEKSGYDICKELKEQETVGKLPVILIGAEEFFEEAKARECDYDGFITKPFLTEELIKSLDVIIKRSHKLFPEIQEISERQTIAPSEPYTMPVSPAEIPSGSIDTTEGAPTREMINQIESDTRDSAVAYQDLFDTDARSITAETQAPSEQEEIKQEESSPEEVIEPQENYGEIAESPAHEDRDEQEVADEVPHEKENTEDLPPENVEPVDNEDAEIDDDEVIRQIDTFTSDDYDDEVSEVKIKKEEASSKSEEKTEMSQKPPENKLKDQLYESLDKEIKNFVASLDRQEILSEIKRMFQDSFERMCKEILPDIAERRVKEKLEEILKEKS